jgi:hypothetical protein
MGNEEIVLKPRQIQTHAVETSRCARGDHRRLILLPMIACHLFSLCFENLGVSEPLRAHRESLFVFQPGNEPE